MPIFDQPRRGAQDIAKSFMSTHGLTTFGYRKFFSDGRNYGFSTDENLDRNFSKLIDNSSTYAMEVEKSMQSGYGIYTRTGIPSKDDTMLWKLYCNFNTWNTIAIYNKGDDGTIEGFYFAATKEKQGLVDQYQTLLPFIHNFILQFKCNALSKLSEDSIDVNDSPRINYRDKSCLNQEQNLQLKNIFITFPDGTVQEFSLREAQCLVNFVLGRSSKEIAKKLAISHRTVETYLKRAYKKIRVNDTVTISKRLLADPINYAIVNYLYL